MVRYAKSIGVYTIVADYLKPEDSIAKLIADEYWMINTADIDKLEEKCKAERASGVFCGIIEFNLEVAMELGKRLGVKTYCTPDIWKYLRDKELFKNLCREIGASTPEDYEITEALSEDELKMFFSTVVKPVDLSGKREIRNYFGGLYIVCVFLVWIALNKYEKIKLGDNNSSPKSGNFCMVLDAILWRNQYRTGVLEYC